jgi:hypothetical protein
MAKKVREYFDWGTKDDTTFIASYDRKGYTWRLKYAKNIHKIEVFVTKRKSINIEIYPAKYIHESMHGWDYRLDAVGEYGGVTNFYDYYLETGKIFKTLEEAREDAIARARKVRWDLEWDD